jgi:ornithine cyclodeaminase
VEFFMQVLVVDEAAVKRLLPMGECIDVMAEALRALGRGEAILPLRPILWLPEKVGALAMMPAYLSGLGAMAVKVISVFPGNLGTDLDSHQGAVLLFEAQQGRLLAILDASEITAIRTAAVSGVATRLLAREDASVLAILGSGVQARTHLQAMLLVRQLETVRVWSRDAEHARHFVERESRRHGIQIEVAATGRDAVRGAHVVCTTTSSREPILLGDWLSPGAHVNAVGSSVPFTRELDTEAVVRARLFTDRRESILNEAGDFLIPCREGAFGDDHVLGEIGDLLLGRVPGRQSSRDITLFKSLGLAIEDLAAAHHIYTKANQGGGGTLVELGGGRHADD